MSLIQSATANHPTKWPVGSRRPSLPTRARNLLVSSQSSHQQVVGPDVSGSHFSAAGFAARPNTYDGQAIQQPQFGVPLPSIPVLPSHSALRLSAELEKAPSAAHLHSVGAGPLKGQKANKRQRRWGLEGWKPDLAAKGKSTHKWMDERCFDGDAVTLILFC